MIPRRRRQAVRPDTSALPFDQAFAWKEDRRDGRPRQRLEVLAWRSACRSEALRVDTAAGVVEEDIPGVDHHPAVEDAAAIGCDVADEDAVTHR